ncbi:MAG: nascent polypeptide-associated complex protein [Methanobacteriota archaeon]|nr:MAG: nascent polypeptide-associated complex protein [Euryarchaeota archaeon]
MDPSQMQKMMKQLGIKTKELDAEEVTIKTATSTLVIKKPQVVEMNMQGKMIYQVVGRAEELPYNEEDISLVMEQAGVGKDEATELLKKAEGDIAKAIMLKQEE